MDLGKFIQVTIKPYSLKLRSFLTFLQVSIVWSATVAEREGEKKCLWEGGGEYNSTICFHFERELLN